LNLNISIGQYYPGDSVLHKADPRAKIVLLATFMVLAFVADSVYEFALLVLFTVCAAAATKIPPRLILRSIKPVLPIILFASVINIFMIPGEPFFRFWIIAPTREGLALAIKMAARISLIILGGSSFLIFTTTPIMLTDGIESLLSPLRRFRVPAHEFAMMMTIALRFIPTLLEEADKIMRAQASRGANFNEGKLIERARSFIPVIIPLFISAFRRADDLANAMEARCYRGGEGRTKLRQLKITKLDVYAFTAFAVFTAFFFFGRVFGWPVLTI